MHRAFILNDKTAGEIMTPIEHTKALSAGLTIGQAAAVTAYARLLERRHQFVPS